MITDTRVRRWSPVGEAIARLLAPHAEVVLHDAGSDRVLALWNPLSARRVGEPSLLGTLDALTPTGSDAYGPYEKLLADGRRFSCVSAVLRDDAGAPDAVLCVNLDRGPLERAAAALAAFAAPVAERPDSLFEPDWAARIHQVVGGIVRDRQRPVERFSRADRVAVLAELDRVGVFAVRRAAPEVARALRVSRSTVYALLAEARADPAAPAPERDPAPAPGRDPAPAPGRDSAPAPGRVPA